MHLPATCESESDPIGRQVGEALWPSHYSVEALEQIRADVGSRVFQCLYQGNVAASQGTIFKRDWFQHYVQRPVHFTKIVQSWDTAYKTGASDDYSVCTTWGVTENGYYLLSAWRERVEFPELKRQVAQQAEQWRPHAILIEDRASGQSLIQELKSATTFPVVPIRIDHDKETRASAVTAFFEAGKVLFPEGAAWLSDFEDELAGFPDSVHDDIVDSITQALNYLRGDGGAYGVLELMKKGWDGFIDTCIAVEKDQDKMLGQPIEAPRSAQVTVESWKKWVKEGKAPPCPRPECGSTNTTLIGGRTGSVVHCNECAANDGVLAVPEEKPGHVHRWRIIPCGWERCDDCAEQRPIGNGPRPTTNGMSRAQYAARSWGYGSSYGRFGGWR